VSHGNNIYGQSQCHNGNSDMRKQNLKKKNVLKKVKTNLCIWKEQISSIWKVRVRVFEKKPPFTLKVPLFIYESQNGMFYLILRLIHIFKQTAQQHFQNKKNNMSFIFQSRWFW
jgi:hypothetical protein